MTKRRLNKKNDLKSKKNRSSFGRKLFQSATLAAILFAAGSGAAYAQDYENLTVDTDGKVSAKEDKPYTLLSTEFLPGTVSTSNNFEFTTIGETFTNEGGIGYSDIETESRTGNLDLSKTGQFKNNGNVAFDGKMSISSGGLINNGQINGNAENGIVSAGDVINGNLTEYPDASLTGSVEATGITNNATMDGLDNASSLTITNDGTITNYSTIQNYKTITAKSLTNNAGALIDNTTNIELSTEDANLTNSGTISNADSISTVMLSNTATGIISDIDNLTASGSLVNQGGVDSEGNLQQGKIENVTTINASTGLTNRGIINDITTINANNGLTNSGTISNVEEINVTGEAELINNKTLENIQTVNGNLTMNEGGTIGMTGEQRETELQGDLKSNDGTFKVRLDAVNGQPAVAGEDNDTFNAKNSAGDVSLNGGTFEVTANDYDTEKPYRAGDRYTVIQGKDIQVQNDLTVNSTFDPRYKGLLKVTADYDQDNYYLNIQRAVSYRPLANSLNGDRFGQYIDDLGAQYVLGGDLEDVLVAMDQASTNPAAARATMAQLDGAVYGSMASMSIQNHTIVNNQLANRLRPNLSRYSCNCCENLQADPCSPNTEFWGSYYGVNGSVDSDGNAFGGDYTVNGVLVGLDKTLETGLKLGGFFAYGGSKFDVDNIYESADADNYKIGLYFTKSGQYGYLLGNVAYGWDNYVVERNITFLNRVNKADLSGNEWSFRLEKGFDMTVGRGLFQPFIGLQYVSLGTDAFNEDGIGATALAVDSSNYTSWRTELGGRYSFNRIFDEQREGNLYLQGSWIHEYSDTHGTVTAAFANPNGANYSGTAKYTVNGVDLGQDWCLLGVGADYTAGNLTFFGGYDFMFSGKQNLNTGSAGLALRF